LPNSHEITRLLHSWSAGDDQSLEVLFPLVYQELRRRANAAYRANPHPTLQPTALVHEAYLRLAQQYQELNSRDHFYAVASVIMRRILVDSARARHAGKRGGGAHRVELEGALLAIEEQQVDVLALDHALCRLAEFDARQARIVEMRFFGGLSNEEIASVLDMSPKSVQRGWALARAWLRQYMSQDRSAVEK